MERSTGLIARKGCSEQRKGCSQSLEYSGNIRYDYFCPLKDDSTVLLIDSWTSQHAINLHHESTMMKTIIALREKYDLHMIVERYVSDDEISDTDQQFIRK